MRPDVGTQAQFKKKKPPVTYRYDSSLSPALDWDGQNSAREQGEAALAEIGRGLTQINADIHAGLIRVDPRSSAAQTPEECRRSGGAPEGVEQAFPELGRQGGAAVIRRAHAAAVRARAAEHQGHYRDAGQPQARHPDGYVQPVRRPAALDYRPGFARLRAPRQVGESHHPGRFAGGHEFAAPLRGPGRPSADDLHGPALRG